MSGIAPSIEEREYLQKFGQRIRRDRLARGLDRPSLEEIAGVHRNTIYNIESGKKTRLWTAICVLRALKKVPVPSKDTTSCVPDAFPVDQDLAS